MANDGIKFLPVSDTLSELINSKANELYNLLKSFDATTLETDPFFKNYFKKHHLGNRLIFSIESSAHILYRSIQKSGKNINDIIIVDYGAGLGTLFMLGSILGVKRFIYNDHLAEWKNNAALICNQLNIPVSDYIVGDIADTIAYAEKNNFVIDIIASRNVIEHIYDLNNFYSLIHTHNTSAIVYSTTTANYQNIATRLQHILIHKKAEKKYYVSQRKAAILQISNQLNNNQLNELINITRGRALQDFTTAVKDYVENKPVAPVQYLGSNTVDHVSGVWAEHLLPKSVHEKIITNSGFKAEYSGGFWDTHYKYPVVNLLTRLLNAIIKLLGNKGYILSPFINVIAYN